MNWWLLVLLRKATSSARSEWDWYGTVPDELQCPAPALLSLQLHAPGCSSPQRLSLFWGRHRTLEDSGEQKHTMMVSAHAHCSATAYHHTFAFSMIHTHHPATHTAISCNFGYI
ncbi:hypothetical protein E2C01_007980 [Portunus trituberculatus]|uniref:Secreted protein n=1 Tax=Portunus trituberculatus TaxID=210409 RepID=A0A5B7CZK0_PORTR|nr:hypothetical protein [Portunus trituberculatus]